VLTVSIEPLKFQKWEIISFKLCNFGRTFSDKKKIFRRVKIWGGQLLPCPLSRRHYYLTWKYIDYHITRRLCFVLINRRLWAACLLNYNYNSWCKTKICMRCCFRQLWRCPRQNRVRVVVMSFTCRHPLNAFTTMIVNWTELVVNSSNEQWRRQGGAPGAGAPPRWVEQFFSPACEVVHMVSMQVLVFGYTRSGGSWVSPYSHLPLLFKLH